KNKPEYRVILAFNVKVLADAEELATLENIRIFKHNVIYRLLEEYFKWLEEYRLMEKLKELDSLVRPGKIRILPGYVFRRSDPAIVGIEVLGGVVKPGYPLMRSDGVNLGVIQQIRDRDNVLKEARIGQRVAVSIKGRIMIGRHVDEGDVMYTDIPHEDVVKLLKKFRNELSNDEIEVLNEIISIKRKQNPFYGLAL
ncbi:MAG: translation initiation factor IF-2, partial [Desulfurococcaceae archaeon]